MTLENLGRCSLCGRVARVPFGTPEEPRCVACERWLREEHHEPRG
jgi:hypothetical protein